MSILMGNNGGVRSKYQAPITVKSVNNTAVTRFNRAILSQYSVSELLRMGLQNRQRVLGSQYTAVQAANNFPLVG